MWAARERVARRKRTAPSSLYIYIYMIVVVRASTSWTLHPPEVMEFLPLLLCLLAAAEARNIFQPEAEDAPEGGCSCDRRFLRHYEARGCVADALDACGCPTKFSCPTPNPADNNSSSSLQVCLYRGQEFAAGSRVPVPDPCQVCRCQEGALSCVTRECPELTATDGGENCHPVYAENKCCPLRYECIGNEIEDDVQAATSKTCRQGDRAYPLGAKIQAEDDPCLVCSCDEWWATNRTCVELDCVMERHRHRLEDGCVPVYHEGRCCPVQFYCPSLNASLSELPVAEETTNTTRDELCFFGGRSYERGKELPAEGDHPCVQCTCAIPPHPTCVHRKCPPPPDPGCHRTHHPGQCCPDYECMLGDEPPAEEEACPTPMCQHTNCRVAVPPGEKCPTCVCGEMMSELEHNHLEQPVQQLQQQQQVLVQEEMEPPSQFLAADSSDEGGLQLMPLVMERSVQQQLGNASDEEEEESEKEVNEADGGGGGGGGVLDGEELRGGGGRMNGTLIINEIWTIDHDIEVPPGCPTPMCEGHWCKILIPEGHYCPTCVCKRFDTDNEP